MTGGEDKMIGGQGGIGRNVEGEGGLQVRENREKIGRASCRERVSSPV